MSGQILKKIKIGDVLVKSKIITEEQLQSALKYQKDSGGKLGDVLAKLNLVDETTLLRALSDQLFIPFIELNQYSIKPEFVHKIPERIARRYRLIIIDKIKEEYLVGMSDPTDLIAFDEVNRILEGKIRLAVVRDSDLVRFIDQVYRRTEDIASFANELKVELVGEDDLSLKDAEDDVSAPVAKLLESIFEDAVQIGASDIHIEPDEKVLRIRQRVDGVLQENVIPSKEIISALVSKIKLIAKLNISEKRLPQDGRFRTIVKGKPIDVRVSTMPVRYGESVVMRLLDQSGGILQLDLVGLPAILLERLKFCIHRPNGMVIVTGPTGSGKTTTLYAILNELNVESKKIITIEDPIEYILPRVNQVQINPLIELTFASVLRAVLRQDPNIIMVGEMRDEETVKIAMRAAMTGHMVLSTMHTNDAISTAMRIMDMGAEGFLVASSLRAIIAQRLIRKICKACIDDYTPTAIEQSWLDTLLGKFDTDVSYKYGKGCSRCHQTGYKGRLGVYELLEIDSAMADALRTNNTSLFAANALKQPYFKPLSIAAYDYVLLGLTTIEEMFRIAAEITDARKSNISEQIKVDFSKISF